MINQLIFFIMFIVPDLQPKENMMKSKLSLLPQVEAALAFIDTIDVSAFKDEIEAGREFYKCFIPMAGAIEEIDQVEDRIISSSGAKPNIGIRIYRPSAEPLLPVVVYFHGGWFTAGGLDTHDRPLRLLAKHAAAVIIAVDYSLAPEYPFPHGLNDCYHALQWVAAHAAELNIDISRIALAGDSAGGALAAATTRRTLTERSGPKISGQVLIYPVTDASLSTASWKKFSEGPNLTLEGAKAAWNLYTPDPEDRKLPDASPLMAEDLSEMPPTHIIMAEYDPLRDEASLYAQKLKDAGVTLTERTYPGMVHGFFQMGGMIDQGNEAIEEVARMLRKYLISSKA